MTDSWTSPWTCPFCPLLCSTAGVRPGPQLAPAGGSCRRAAGGLARFADTPSAATPRVAGRAATLDEAVAEAARLLAAAGQPLFGGLGTDVAGARALYPLACATGAICDAAGGAVLFEGVRAQQDRGGFTTTIAEVATRADLLLRITPDTDASPADDVRDLLDRCGEPGPELLALPVEAGDLFDTLALLAALAEGRGAVRARAPAALVEVADRLRAARYAVLVYETRRLPAHGGLAIEALQRTVAALNRSTRAAALGLGGGDGAYTVNQVFTWLSGLPLRSRAGPAGLEHEPLRFDARRLLADGAADVLLWLSSFGVLPVPAEAAGVPRIVIGHPEQAASDADDGDAVFIPVSTPGIGSAGHLFRADGSVVLPLRPLYDDTLPTAADVLRRITQALPQGHS
ncbi:formylmethanofuran dehydrogenase [Aquincola sp. MAHUQ-54]|uniref:Formylmethanofuran dehydrogenase n=1 Tax=Aquincola agrisoli TaxID=3119538 RepID=A0AAW9Q1Z0_9BURK